MGLAFAFALAWVADFLNRRFTQIDADFFGVGNLGGVWFPNWAILFDLGGAVVSELELQATFYSASSDPGQLLFGFLSQFF